MAHTFGQRAPEVYKRAFWIVVVITGIVSSAFVINNSFKAWEETPVITSVAQHA
ncbi:Hypothetical protein FKW44_000694 [Caligus rogercresseyi]|uniref:Uncharacterized protein n=1 Tax=Caligus rogercresseyi TaxID=217165 RepID=A0A7T8QV16_CALRO|nr:Hypothetical protein FKW44_000694 [Caligus rogercresseyi]